MTRSELTKYLDVIDWEKKRRMGFFGFAMVVGVGVFGLGLGSTGACAYIAWMYSRHGPDLVWNEVGIFPLFFVGFMIAVGFWASVFIWFDRERRYRRFIKELGCKPPPGTGDPDAG